MKFLNRPARLIISILILSAVFVGTALATPGQSAIVTENGLRLRTDPALDAPIVAVAREGAEVTIIDESANGWYEVMYRDQTGFMSAYYLQMTDETAQEADPLMAYVNTGSSVLNMRSGPGTAYDVLGTAKAGSLLPVISKANGWYEVRYNDASAYASADYVLLMTQSEYDVFKNNQSVEGQQIAEFARQFIGYPYVYGGNGPNSFDCSGFVKYIYAQFGYTLNRTATDQLKNGIAVPLDTVQPGDLVFFRAAGTVKPVSHVGLYVGDGQFIHASTSIRGVVYDDLNSKYYSSIYVYARRII